MHVAELTAIGPAHEVVRVVEVADPSAPAGDEIIVRMRACSINPADLLLIEGKYAARPEIASRLGIEGVGVVEAVGADVSHLSSGDTVLSLGRTNWADRVVLKGTQAIRLPADIDVEQAAMLKVNAATAYRMLQDYVDLGPGDWVIQNAANSGVGINLIRLAAARGVRTVNVVRRVDLIEPLMTRGRTWSLLARRSRGACPCGNRECGNPPCHRCGRGLRGVAVGGLPSLGRGHRELRPALRTALRDQRRSSCLQ